MRRPVAEAAFVLSTGSHVIKHPALALRALELAVHAADAVLELHVAQRVSEKVVGVVHQRAQVVAQRYLEELGVLQDVDDS